MVEIELDGMDLDIDFGPVDDVNEPLAVKNATPDYAVPSSQIPASALTPHKVYVRGLEDLTTSDINTFCSEHYPMKTPPRVEWIDDTSANLVFKEEQTALLALYHFTLPSDDNESLPMSQLRSAKALSTHPSSSLYMRLAATTDQKRPRAYEASRFYMMHPEHDPREQRRQGRSLRGNSDHCRKGYSDDEQRRRRRKDKEDVFDASMYDDAGASSRRDSISSSASERDLKRKKIARFRGDSYRPARYEKSDAHASRDRSASPNARNRYTPPPTYRSRDPHPFPHGNGGKELFPSIARSVGDADCNATDSFSSSALTTDVPSVLYSRRSAFAAPNKELFGNRARAAEVKKELFPHKVGPSKHSRSDAFDAADETADLFANGLSVLFTDASKSRKSAITRLRSGSQPQIGGGDVGIGLNIRGASREQDQGFSIRGGATVNAVGMTKELFPSKANEGKELFAEKVEGRGGRRNRAEDMFF